jgi:hypothetical protein
VYSAAANPRIKNHIINVRMTAQHVEAVDRLADDIGESRSAALRIVVRAGLAALGAAR